MKIFSMDTALKRRLIMAIFVVVLVVIFLPMLFESKDESQSDMTKEMPTPPPSSSVIEQKIETLDVRTDAPLTPPAATETAQPSVVPVHSSPTTPILATAHSLSEAGSEQQDHLTTATKTLSPSVTTEVSKGLPHLPDLPVLKASHVVQNAVSKTPEKNSYMSSMRTSDVTSQDVLKNVSVRLKKASVAKQAWVVQLGSFTQTKNAESVVKRLQANNFKAFTYHYQAAGKWLSRVYVGPFVRLNEAKEMREQLISKMHLKAIVASFHPTKMSD